MSTNKAITFDGFSDKWIKNLEQTQLINDVWNKKNLNKIVNLGEARLIPLNKVWPEIPDTTQFRPIVVLSPITNFLELRFHHKL